MEYPSCRSWQVHEIRHMASARIVDVGASPFVWFFGLYQILLLSLSLPLQRMREMIVLCVHACARACAARTCADASRVLYRKPSLCADGFMNRCLLHGVRMLLPSLGCVRTPRGAVCESGNNPHRVPDLLVLGS